MQPATTLAAMHLLIAEWPYGATYGIVFLWAYLPEVILNQRSRALLGPQDAGSFRLVIIVQSVALAGAFLIALTGRFGGLAQQRLWFWIGLTAMIGGSLLRRHCFRMLGSSFTAVVVVKPEQQVVERGAYRWIRHPSYSAGVLMSIGIALVLGNWLSTLVVLIAVLATYSYRVRIEERALVAMLGEPYRAYMTRTKRFIPMVL